MGNYAADGFFCQQVIRERGECKNCGSKDLDSLLVHHLRYPGGKRFPCTREDVEVLCNDCHRSLHQLLREKYGTHKPQIDALWLDTPWPRLVQAYL